MGLLPLSFGYIITATKGEPVVLANFLADGELQLISTGIAAGAINDLFGSKQLIITSKTPSRVAIFFCIIVACLASVSFATIAALPENLTPSQEQAIIQHSIVLFITALVAGASCVALSEL
jgi:hypothetical protein